LAIASRQQPATSGNNGNSNRNARIVMRAAMRKGGTHGRLE
jgi:hypothetical protein